ncbi:uncharacterized protein B0T15DRAFT_262446 [Chaetomium strumarium]|uniref:Uncharacterized protein n=1 Tax=Chaetomium strumarium TaxID=1170767 RepID=A0AAJ0LZ88_9PEZI|nr:hypothetical protein B0T15DRAFT_262446 [Chaetomium strumarium]
MRYDDWDIILFPAGRDSKIPFKEFKVACHVVPDLELAHIHGAGALPVMTCFVPSLAAGNPFQISLHCWRQPDISQFTRAYSRHSNLVRFEARILVDGRLVASTILDRDVNGPHLITNTFEFTKTGELERLKFPRFRQELLVQNHWNPGDDIGRIKIIISEGFPRDSLSAPIERVKNVVAFSFQHAPLEILESSGIAWPNPSMWRSAAFAPVMPVPTYHAEDGVSSHTHSPGRRPSLLRNTPGLGFPPPGLISGIPQAQAGAGFLGTQDLQMPHLGRSNIGSGNNTPSCSDPFGDSGYFEWVNSMTSGQLGDSWDGKTLWPANARNSSKQSSDTVMPDYVPREGSDPMAMHISGPSLEDDRGSLKVPTNTPTGGAALSKQNTQFQMPRQGASLLPDFASCLTQSLLNQPFVLPAQHHAFPLPPAEPKSLKDIHDSTPGHADVSAMQSATDISNSESCKASQQMFGLEDLDSTTPIPASSELSGKEDYSSPALENLFQTSSRNPSGGGDFGSVITNFPGSSSATPSLPTPSMAGHAELSSAGPKTGTAAATSAGGNSNGGGSTVARRTRNFTPASIRAIDDEDEPRRGSPLVRIAGYSGADIRSNVGQ